MGYAPELKIRDKDLENLGIDVDTSIPAENKCGNQRRADIILKYSGSNDSRSNINEQLVLFNLKREIRDKG